MISLKSRNTALTEEMDKASCNEQKLFRTYDQFQRLNRMLTGWKALFRAHIVPLARTDQPLRILDVGCGGGDLCRSLADWAARSSIHVEITGVDPDPRAFRYSQTRPRPETVRFLQGTTTDLVQSGETFDVVLSNHLLHHLTNSELTALCREAEELTTGIVLFNDIHRSRLGYTLFGTFAPLLFRKSFIVQDGLTSIRRSFRQEELQSAVPEGWQVETLFPWRLLASYRISETPGPTRTRQPESDV